MCRPQLQGLEGRLLPTTVNTLADTGPGSLRDALANTPAGGTVDFQPGLTGTITLTSAHLTIDHSLMISGPGAANLAVSGNDQFTVFNITSGITASISGLSIIHGGYTAAPYGGESSGIQNQGTLTLSGCIISASTRFNGAGGGIQNSGTMTVNACIVRNNAAIAAGSLASAVGGGIGNSGMLTVIASTVSDNFAGGQGEHTYGSGGGIANAGTLTVINSTISDNTAQGGPFSIASGGGIRSDGNLTVINSTISGNTAVVGGAAAGGGVASSGPVNLTNTLVAGNTAQGGLGSGYGPDINGTVSQADHNLIGIGDGSTGLVDGQTGNQVGTAASPIDSKLGPLQDNGGATPTQALLPGSPALDAGDNTASPGPTDQRGQPRIANQVIDIGAYEFQGATLGPALVAIGGAGRVQVRRARSGALVADFTPYGASYTGSIAVAVGDLDGSGFPDLVTAPLDGNPHVKVYSGQALLSNFDPANPDASLVTSFFAYGLDFNIGANVAVGDISGDGFPDLVTGATAGNPQVKVYDGQAIAQHTFDPANPDASVLAAFFAYGINFNIGANVAVGDVNHDGFADLVTGATAGNPQVKVYDGQAIAHGTFNNANPDASLLTSFFAFGLDFNVGAFVTVGDVTGNGYGDVIVGASAGNPQVKVYDSQAIATGAFNGDNPDASLLTSFFAYALNFDIGASVAAADFDVGGPADILTGAAEGAPHYRVVIGLSTGVQPPAEHGIDAIASDIDGGILVGA